MRILRFVVVGSVLAGAASLAPTLNARVDTADTKLLTQPAISASHVAFIYAVFLLLLLFVNAERFHDASLNLR